MTTKKRKPRIFTEDHRRRLERAVVLYLALCYRERTPARVSEFAAFLRRTPEYLTRVTWAVFGVTLHTYLRNKQLQEAERLLLTTPMKIKKIALHAGFGTTATLYRIFKETHGMPPGQFRKVRK
ncbi:MAG TPA: helix-turn-helix transcriptional regulator [Thermoanaerobaculia bacterium]|nr:helix-turn-helix transcriptional regulator [Thermoanaerobaculia bacterium]